MNGVRKKISSNSPNFHKNAFPEGRAAICKTNNTSCNHWKAAERSLGAQVRMLIQLLKGMNSCVSAGKLRNKRINSLMLYIGRLHKCTGFFLRKTEREKSQPSDITTPSVQSHQSFSMSLTEELHSARSFTGLKGLPVC